MLLMRSAGRWSLRQAFSISTGKDQIKHFRKVRKRVMQVPIGVTGEPATNGGTKLIIKRITERCEDRVSFVKQNFGKNLILRFTVLPHYIELLEEDVNKVEQLKGKYDKINIYCSGSAAKRVYLFYMHLD